MALDRSSSDYQALWKTVVGEAVGESKRGQIAVAWVVMNRANNPHKWPHTIHDVCYQPYQFECVTNPNLGNLMRSAAAKGIDAWLPSVFLDHSDPTDGANHYYAFAGAQGISPPSWARPDGHTVDIGHHRFYRL